MSVRTRRISGCRSVLLATLCAALVACGGSGGSPGGGKPNLLFAADEQVLKPFVWSFRGFDASETNFQALLDAGDPFRVTSVLTKDWLERRDVVTTEARIDRVIAQWRLMEPGTRLDYKFPYGGLESGWWSGMDSWSFPMLLIGVWQETGKSSYRTLADRLIAGAMRDVQDGGTVWRSVSGCWISEYAWPGMSEADELHVLNGHLYALQAIRMIADATERSDLADLYRCGLRATKALSARFLIADEWVFYMLGPKTIDQTHYVIFETMQLDALARLDPDPFYLEQASLRRALIQRYFPVYLRSVDGANRLFISAIGAPHPYSVDTYALELSCRDAQRAASYSLDRPSDPELPAVERAFLDVATELSASGTTCSVDAVYIGQKQRLYDAPVKNLPDAITMGDEVPFHADAILDAVLLPDGTVSIDPTRQVSAIGEPSTYLDTQGRFIMSPDVSVGWSADELLAFDFDADGELSVGMTVTSNGTDYFRYYPRTRAGPHNLILLSPVGFDNGENITSMDGLTLFFYTDKQTQTVTVRPNRLILFHNQAELYEYLKASGAYLYAQ